ncbi:Tn3 family transposase [Streptomyces sp. NWU339]|uniref:Tn3 family transposase n=1 Tax=Streptomyces sp. NWU339 TaxID=2185284 RepID=UPI0035C7FC1E
MARTTSRCHARTTAGASTPNPGENAGSHDNRSSDRARRATCHFAADSGAQGRLFRLLGHQFSPRLADAGSATLYRVDPGADYGPLNPLTRDRINLRQITSNADPHWPVRRSEEHRVTNPCVAQCRPGIHAHNVVHRTKPTPTPPVRSAVRENDLGQYLGSPTRSTRCP